MYLKEIKSDIKPEDIFNLYSDEDYFFYLDSGVKANELGKYSFLGFNPIMVFKNKKDKISIIKNGTETLKEGSGVDYLKFLLDKYKMNYKSEFPFIGGFVGFLSYDFGSEIEFIKEGSKEDIDIPTMSWGLYDTIFIYDNFESKLYISSLGIKADSNELVSKLEEDLLRKIKSKNDIISKRKEKDKEIKAYLNYNKDIINNLRKEFEDNSFFKSNMDKNYYIKSIGKVKDYIRSGDVYQINFTHRLSCKKTKTSQSLFLDLKNINPAPFAGYLDLKDSKIISSSPERFIQVRDKKIMARPIKGTISRGKNKEEDLINKDILLNSEKDKSELLMIVDLERNDLSKVAKTKTVRVPELFTLEEYATVYHLVANVEAELEESKDLVDLIKATFPGGSITGAPKIRAMEIIEELEPTKRNIYTGSLGYIGLNMDMDLNICIRTIIEKDDEFHFQVGGGIVWDSNPESEYEETFHKGKALMKSILL